MHLRPPMAERAFGDAGATAIERNASTLAKWIVRTRPQVVNTREVRDTARLQGMRDVAPIREACMRLVEAGWLFPPARDASTGGRATVPAINNQAMAAHQGRCLSYTASPIAQATRSGGNFSGNRQLFHYKSSDYSNTYKIRLAEGMESRIASISLN